jgi:hypothetical protein
MRELTEAEFQQTFGKRMIDITQIEILEPIDIWGYVQQLVATGLVKQFVVDQELVERVYRNDLETFDHLLLPTENQFVFVVVVVDLLGRKILGHILLDLEEKYGSS